MKMERTIEDLIADLKSTDDFTREEAIGELEMKGDEVVDPLIDALSDRNKNVKIAAIQILANIGDEKAIDEAKTIYLQSSGESGFLLEKTPTGLSKRH